jgi:hypothetical protein
MSYQTREVNIPPKRVGYGIGRTRAENCGAATDTSGRARTHIRYNVRLSAEKVPARDVPVTSESGDRVPLIGEKAAR